MTRSSRSTFPGSAQATTGRARCRCWRSSWRRWRRSRWWCESALGHPGAGAFDCLSRFEAPTAKSIGMVVNGGSAVAAPFALGYAAVSRWTCAHRTKAQVPRSTLATLPSSVSRATGFTGVSLFSKALGRRKLQKYHFPPPVIAAPDSIRGRHDNGTLAISVSLTTRA